MRIAGVMTRNGEDPDPLMLQRMLSAIGHRGPDGSATVIRGNTGLVLFGPRSLISKRATSRSMAQQAPRWWRTVKYTTILSYVGRCLRRRSGPFGLRTGRLSR